MIMCDEIIKTTETAPAKVITTNLNELNAKFKIENDNNLLVILLSTIALLIAVGINVASQTIDQKLISIIINII